MPYKSKAKQRAAMKRWRAKHTGYMSQYGRTYYRRFTAKRTKKTTRANAQRISHASHTLDITLDEMRADLLSLVGK